MDANSYVGYFKEIRELESSAQICLLELARVEAFHKQKLSGWSALYFVLSLLTAPVIVVLAYLLFGKSWTVYAVALALGIFAANRLFRMLKRSPVAQRTSGGAGTATHRSDSLR